MKPTQAEDIALRMRHQVASFMVEYFKWINAGAMGEGADRVGTWELDIGLALRRVRSMWAEHLRKNPLPEYPAA